MGRRCKEVQLVHFCSSVIAKPGFFFVRNQQTRFHPYLSRLRQDLRQAEVGFCVLRTIKAAPMASQLSGPSPFQKRTARTMTDHLQIDVIDDEIVVTLPGTRYSVTNYNPEGQPQLLAK